MGRINVTPMSASSKVMKTSTMTFVNSIPKEENTAHCHIAPMNASVFPGLVIALKKRVHDFFLNYSGHKQRDFGDY